MKKILIIIAVIFLILVGALFAIPTFFKQNLLYATKATINKQVNAEVQFADFNLSLFQNFPKVTLELEEVLIIGKNEFQNDTLLNVSFARATTSLASLFKKSGMSIEEITLEKPELKMVVNESGKSNWDLSNSNEPKKIETANKAATNSGFELQLEKIQIKNATFLYNDQLAKLALDLTNINFNVSGKMYGSSTELVTEGKVEDFTLKYDNVKYISNTSLETKTVLNVNYDNMNISIAENELLINKLALELTGNIEIPSDSMFFDIQIKTKESDFDNFLALVPPDYEEYLKDIKTSGSAAIAGSLKGLLFEENYPGLSLNLVIKNGNFQYAELPEQIKNIKADVQISKPQGELNLTEVKIKDAHAEIKNSPVDLTLTLKNLIADPWFDGAFIGKINFDHLKDVLPLDSVNVSGLVDANLFVKGNYSAIENEEYDEIKSDGIVMLDNFIYDSKDLTKQIFVPKGQLIFSPKNINLQEFNMKVGQSDFNLSGKISNYLNYILKDGTLKGNLQLNSNLVNLNELLRLQVPKQNEVTENTNSKKSDATTNKEEEVLAFNIPKNIDVTFRSNIKNAIFDRVPISNIDGLITAKNGKLILNGLNMQMLDGELKLNGSYENTPGNQPLVDFGFDVISFDIPMAYHSISGIRQLLPVAGQSQGKLNTNFKMKGRLSPNHKLIASSINGNGLFSTNNLQILDSPIFNQLKGILKSEKLKNVSIDDFKANFKVDAGNIQLSPFITKVAGQETTMFGTLSAENLLNMRLDFKVERDAFGSDIQNILSILPGNKKITIVPAGVIITGPVGNPDVKMDLSETRKTITNATKDDIQKSLNKLGEGLKKLFK